MEIKARSTNRNYRNNLVNSVDVNEGENFVEVQEVKKFISLLYKILYIIYFYYVIIIISNLNN
jgi:hypothetical protein